MLWVLIDDVTLQRVYNEAVRSVCVVFSILDIGLQGFFFVSCDFTLGASPVAYACITFFGFNA